MAESNRRHFPRQNEEATIQALITPDDSNGRKESCDSIPAKMCNQSEDGLYIEIDRALQPGSSVSIKMFAPEEDHPEDAYYMHNTRVIWCEKVDDETSRFGIGVKILRSIVRAEVLNSRLG
ncbi:MAG: PilZ domain-containing protein [Desulfobacterales bacterium]|nr:PilZ domain-containing protein [Desulfobacterales bacterium]